MRDAQTHAAHSHASDAAPDACEDAVCRRRDEMFDAMRRATSGTDAGNRSVACPPDVDELGRGAWTLMHAVAARYPVRGRDETREREGMRGRARERAARLTRERRDARRRSDRRRRRGFRRGGSSMRSGICTRAIDAGTIFGRMWTRTRRT